MKRTDLLLFCVAFANALPLFPQGTGNKKNILLITIDDMNIWPGCFDNVAQTPNIDKLASKSTVFSNSHCVVPASNPSRTALFTGMRPETTGQYTNEGCFRDKRNNITLTTLPQYLQQNGYQTVSAGKVFHHPRGKENVPNKYSDPQSWDIQPKSHVGIKGKNLYINEKGFGKWHNGEIKGYLGTTSVWGPVPYKKEESEEWKNMKFCADYLNEKHDKPFFLACGIFTPHAPHIAPQEYFDHYPLDKIILPNVKEDDFNDIPKIAHSNFSTPFFKLMKEKGEWKKAVQGYLACMSFADDVLGELLRALSNSEYADNTIVILLTDNGFQLGHKNRWEKYSLWRMATNTPLIIHDIKQTKKLICSKSVSLLGLYPTLLDMLGIEKPDFLEGHSFKQLVSNPNAEYIYPAVITHGPGNVSIVKDNWNYIRYSDGSEELYNRKLDINEFNNLSAEKKYKSLKEELAKYIPIDKSRL